MAGDEPRAASGANGNGRDGDGQNMVGQILLENQALRPAQLTDALQRQELLADKHRYYLLGRILVGLGYASSDDVKEALAIQKTAGPGSGRRARLTQPAEWLINTATGPVRPISAVRALDDIDEKVVAGELETMLPMPLGFDPLDEALGGGVRPGELLLIGGGQGVGKTTLAFQMARNVAAAGEGNCLYVCYEHDEENLTHRLIAMESINPARQDVRSGVSVRELTRQIASAREHGGGGLYDLLERDPRSNASLERLRRYGDRLFLLKGSGARTTLSALTGLIEAHRVRSDERLVLFVDYLQKVPVIPEPATEQERVTKVVEGLKELAMAHQIPVVAVVAADPEGLKAKRMRAHHLAGGSALAYEADVILMLADKFDAVARVHLEFNPQKAERFRDWIICSVEKNRSGRNVIDVEFEKLFSFCSLNPNGHFVTEKLIDERLYVE